MTETYTFNLPNDPMPRRYTYDPETGLAENSARGTSVNIGRDVDFPTWLMRAGAFNIRRLQPDTLALP